MSGSFRGTGTSGRSGPTAAPFCRSEDCFSGNAMTEPPWVAHTGMRTSASSGAKVPMTKQADIPFVRPMVPAFDAMAPDLRAALESGALTKGRYLDQYEAALAEHLEVRHAIAVSSCTLGLALVYRLLGLKGEVIVPSFTFMP